MAPTNRDLIRKKYSEATPFKSLVWDYNMTPQEFFLILSGKKVLAGLNQDWAIGRVLENTNYYDAIGLIGEDLLKQRWDFVKNRIHNKEIMKGYEYLLRRQTLPSPK